jgi:hypothetical protein
VNGHFYSIHKDLGRPRIVSAHLVEGLDEILVATDRCTTKHNVFDVRLKAKMTFRFPKETLGRKVLRVIIGQFCTRRRLDKEIQIIVSRPSQGKTRPPLSDTGSMNTQVLISFSGLTIQVATAFVSSQ